MHGLDVEQPAEPSITIEQEVIIIERGDAHDKAKQHKVFRYCRLHANGNHSLC